MTVRSVHKQLIAKLHPNYKTAECDRQAGGCPFYVPLEGSFGADWGVVVNPKSSNFGKCVFEHADCGCPKGSHKNNWAHVIP